MALTTTAINTVQSGTSFTVDVTAANLLPSTSVKDFVVINSDTSEALDVSNFTKDSQTQISYSGASIGTDVNLEIRRSTPVARYQDISFLSKVSSAVINEEFDRIIRRQAEFDTFGSGPQSTGISREPLNQAYGSSWQSDTNRGRTANNLYDKFEAVEDAYQAADSSLLASINTNTTSIANLNSLKANVASPTLTGVPTAPTAASGTSTAQIATTAFVQGLLISPGFTDTPTTPTAALNTDTTQVASTEYVMNAKPQVAIIWDRKAAGTQGGAGGGTGNWFSRDLNHKAYDAIGITVASNQFTLPGATKPGQYLINTSQPFYRTSRTQTRLFNVTDNAVVTDSYSPGVVVARVGDSAGDVAGSNTPIQSTCVVTITANKAYRLEYRIENSNSGSALNLGFENNSFWTVPFEYYSMVEVTYLGNAA